MDVLDPWRRRLAAQLANPQGRFGRIVARRLNTRNLPLMTAAVAAVDLAPGGVAADIGFGGGLGLRLLLDAVGSAGRVHGVDRSPAALAEARRRYAADIAAGRLSLHDASMTGLPLPDAALDGVITTNTIYFVDDAGMAAAFAEYARVLRPAGRLAMGIGDPDAMAADPLMAHGFQVRPIDGLVAAAAAAGLTLAAHRRSQAKRYAPHVLVFTPA